MSRPAQFDEAARSFDAASAQASEHDAEQQRQETLRRYPRDQWPEMALEDYALGQADHPDNFCRWIERQTDQMGSIRGGSSRKLIIYKHAKKPGWYFPPSLYRDEREAWEAVRTGFIQAFELADQGRWSEIDSIEALAHGPALVVKTLWAYFPEDLLPITSTPHLRHFLRIVGEDAVADDDALGAVQLNRSLLTAIRETPELEELTTKAIERFLYMRFSPFEGELIKIAPGHEAQYWDECHEGGFICVGWEQVGDLRQFESKEAFVSAFNDVFSEKHPTQGKRTEKANELWSLMDIAVGDQIVANRGISEVLGVGTVVPPGYVWDESRDSYNHTLRVEWDTTYAKQIPPEKRWGVKTILPLKGEIRDLILNRSSGPSPPPVVEEPIFAEIAEALERKGQAVLYGPPGTGKTWTADRFAKWWAGTGTGSREALVMNITFHPSYSYEDFVEGFRPVEEEDGRVGLQLEKGMFRDFCERARSNPDRRHLLVIDEINRANIAKVFGELITLLEKDKRDRPLELPYSKESFSVPPNVYLLGTMNTADRSIKLVDIALRRRFGFVELMPTVEPFADASVEGLELSTLLESLNKRVARTAGRERQIGHSFFMQGGDPITEPAQFTQVFRSEVVPLLQEYAGEDFDELSEYLGTQIVDVENLTLNKQVLTDPSSLLAALEAHLLGGASSGD